MSRMEYYGRCHCTSFCNSDNNKSDNSRPIVKLSFLMMSLRSTLDMRFACSLLLTLFARGLFLSLSLSFSLLHTLAQRTQSRSRAFDRKLNYKILIGFIYNAWWVNSWSNFIPRRVSSFLEPKWMWSFVWTTKGQLSVLLLHCYTRHCFEFG